MSGVMSLLSLSAFMVWTGKTYKRVTFSTVISVMRLFVNSSMKAKYVYPGLRKGQS